MKGESYPLIHSEDYCYFEFVSRSKTKDTRKVILYSPLTPGSNQYNLLLAEVLLNGNLCDETVSNNGDMGKIFATVIHSIFIFFRNHKAQSVYFTGSTPARTRLYRAIINRELSEAEKYFEIYGVRGSDPEPFKPDVRYVGYILKLKRTLQ